MTANGTGADDPQLAGSELDRAASPTLTLLKELWKEGPTVHRILRESPTLEEARERLARYLDELEWHYRALDSARGAALHPLEWATALEAIEVFKNLISPRNERLAGVSTLEWLWRLAQAPDSPDSSEAIEKLSEGFIEEFRHLFRAIGGKAGIARGWLGPLLEAEGTRMIDFSKIQGRAAGVARSDYLDRLSAKISTWIERFPSGLDPRVIEERKRNREKILDYFGGTLDDWYRPRWQLEHILKGPEGLAHLQELVPLTEEEVEAIRLAVENEIPWGITPYYLSLFDFESADRHEDYQVRSQVIPPMHYVQRMIEHRGDREYYFDFMGEHDTSPLELITRRYASIAILKASDTCPQVCVYCQRNWEITGPMMPGGIPTMEEIDRALDWFAEHPAMKDVLITGGDPFILNDAWLKHIMDRLSQMDHVVNIRWGTRIPVTMPMRITDELAELLGSYIEPGRRNVAVVTHIESAYEVTPELAEAVWRLRRQGIYVYNQQVFTVETSRRFQTVATRIAMKKAGVDPYYTFYPKGKEEHKDYLVPIARVLQERKEEARLLPGIFRTDEPVFNVPRLGKNHLRAWQDHELIAIRPDGKRVYLFHPWEKGIAPVEPWVYVDTAIHDYLRELERRGEDPKDYESIWYYY